MMSNFTFKVPRQPDYLSKPKPGKSTQSALTSFHGSGISRLSVLMEENGNGCENNERISHTNMSGQVRNQYFSVASTSSSSRFRETSNDKNLDLFGGSWKNQLEPSTSRGKAISHCNESQSGFEHSGNMRNQNLSFAQGRANITSSNYGHIPRSNYASRNTDQFPLGNVENMENINRSNIFLNHTRLQYPSTSEVQNFSRSSAFGGINESLLKGRYGFGNSSTSTFHRNNSLHMSNVMDLRRQQSVIEPSFEMSMFRMRTLQEGLKKEMDLLESEFLNSKIHPEMLSFINKCKNNIQNLVSEHMKTAGTLSMRELDNESCISRSTIRLPCLESSVRRQLGPNDLTKQNEMKAILFSKTTVRVPKKKPNLNEEGSDEFDNTVVEVEDFHFKKPKIQFRQPQKTSKKPKKIKLRQWLPIAVGCDLVLRGTNDDNQIIQTVAIKKRSNNHEVQLADGLQCQLIGKPDLDVSFPPEIVSRLQNGLHQQWRVLQKMIWEWQEISKKKQDNSKVQKKVDQSTPITRKKMFHSTPISSTAHVKNITPLVVLERTKGSNVQNTATFSAGREQSPRLICRKTVKRLPPKQRSLLNSPQKNSERGKKGASKSPVFLSRRASRSPEKAATKSLEKNFVDSGKKKSPAKNLETRIVRAGRCSPRKQVPQKTNNSESKKENESEKQERRTKSGRAVKPVGGFWNGAFFTGSPIERKKKADSTVNPVPEAKEDSVAEKRTNKQKQSVKTVSLVKRKREEDVSESVEPKKKKRPSFSFAKNKEKKKTVPAPKKKGRSKTSKDKSVAEDFDDFECPLDNFDFPELPSVNPNFRLNMSEFKKITAETPPLKAFSKNLKLLNHVTPVQTPDWEPTDRSKTQVIEFQKRRAQSHKQKVGKAKRKSPVKKKAKGTPHSKDVRGVMEWIKQRDVKSPTQCSQVLKYVIPSREQLEDDDEEEEEEEEEVVEGDDDEEQER